MIEEKDSKSDPISATLMAEAQKAFDESELGNEMKGSPNRFAIGEIWKQGWAIGWMDGSG